MLCRLGLHLVKHKHIMKKAITIIASLLPLLSFAHTGDGVHEHPDSGYSIFHYFVQKEHAVITWPMVVLAVVALYLHYRKKRPVGGKSPSSPSDHA